MSRPFNILTECSYLEFFGVTGIENIREGVDRGDGQIGTYSCPILPELPDCPTIESALHAIVAASPLLSGLLAPELWVTGRYDGNEPTYCTINRDGGSPQIHFNDGRVDDVDIRFQTWVAGEGDCHGRGSKIQTAIIETFNNLSLNLAGQEGNVCILLGRVANNFAVQEADRTWQFLTDIKFEVSK